MAGKPYKLICVGKIKQPFIQMGCQLYLERLKPLRTIKVTEIRDSNPKLSVQERKKEEGQNLLQAIGSKDYPIVLDLAGQSLSSEGLANLLNHLEQEPGQIPTFIIGGPYGLDQEVLAVSRKSLALSCLTFTHELARLILLEQIYRAHCIIKHLPYHN